MRNFKIYCVKNKLIEENEGTKAKYWTIVEGNKALIKINMYLDDEYDLRSWNVSEKLYSEISNYIGFSCVKTDFIVDFNNKYGIASYDYKNDFMKNIYSGDKLFFSVFKRFSEKVGDKDLKISKKDYTYNNILRMLLHYDADGKLLIDFNRIMILDALCGESDRHFENWGIYSLNATNYELLPAYDNSSCLLHEFRDGNIMKNIMNKKTLKQYAESSKCKVSIEGKIYSHFDFIDYLLKNLPINFRVYLINDLKRLKLLSDKFVKDLVNKIPNELCTNEHKKLIIDYIILRRDILLKKVESL